MQIYARFDTFVEARGSQRRKIAATFATTKPSTFTRSTHYVYCKFIGQGKFHEHVCRHIERKRDGEKKRTERKLMHGCTRANPDVNREERMEKRERKKMSVDDKDGARCDEVCRNILQPKPINKRRLGRRIKTHTSRYWLRVAAFPHFLALAKLVLHHLYLPSVSHSPCISRRKPIYVPIL